jgi:hypothetical protein
LSAKSIREDTKPCPKCHERIFKIDGCDQMFCMARDEAGRVCEAVWSWRTGEETPGVIVHNPHAFALQRERGYVPRNAGDVHCGGMPEIHPILQLIRHIMKIFPEEVRSSLGLQQFNSEVQTLYRRLNEHVQYEVPRYRNIVRRHPEVMRRNRISYILTSLSKEDFADLQYRTEKDYQKSLEMLHTLELISVCGIEMFQSLIQDTPSVVLYNDCMQAHPDYTHELIQNLRGKISNFHTVIDFCNEKLKEVSITYHSTVPIYDNFCGFSNKKFKMNGDEIKKKA